MFYVFVNREKPGLIVERPISDNPMLTARVAVLPHHPGQVLTPLYMAATDHLYDVYSVGDGIVDEIRKMTTETPAEKDDNGKVTKKAVSADIAGAIALVERNGSLVAKLGVSYPRVSAAA